MALNFPDNPTPGQQYTDPNGILWEYNGTVWNASINGPTIGATGATGPAGSGANIAVYDEGNLLTNSVTSFDFVGSAVTATNVSGAVTVTITGGTGDGATGATGPTGATGFGIDEYARTLAILALG